jgi:pimeloyl-ACP methyl ester carboxylesterase
MSATSDSQPVEFDSDGSLLRGRLYSQKPGGPDRPIVIMTHGFSATITGMVADRYAGVLHAAGFDVLLFDHRSFGFSGGEPRQVVNRWTQLRGYQHAMDFVTTLPGIDPARIALWGDSMSGAIAVAAAAFDQRVRAVIAQVPACGSQAPPEDPDGAAFHTLREIYRAGGPQGIPVERVGPMAVVSPNQFTAPSLLTPITAFRWFIDYGARPGTGWLNHATLETPTTPVPFHVGLCTPHMHAASFWAIAEDDEMHGAEPGIALAVYRNAQATKNLLTITGGHFGLLYHPSPLFHQVSEAQKEFLCEHL